MADEIKITVNEGGVRVISIDTIEITFDVYHYADAVYMAQDVVVSGAPVVNTLKNKMAVKAQEIYNNYQQQKTWTGYELPISWDIDKP